MAKCSTYSVSIRPPQPTTHEGTAWLVRSSNGAQDFVVATRFGLRRVETFNDLLVALDAICDPTVFPLAEWPGVAVSVIC